MGHEQRLNISIKNERIVLLEKRMATVEQLLLSQIRIVDQKMDGNTAALKDLLGTLGNIQSELEFIYEELISRTVRGRFKRLKELLRKSDSKRGDKNP